MGFPCLFGIIEKLQWDPGVSDAFGSTALATTAILISSVGLPCLIVSIRHFFFRRREPSSFSA
jgi:hypothetical protein